jgi:hypothetical protein
VYTHDNVEKESVKNYDSDDDDDDEYPTHDDHITNVSHTI